MPNDRNSGKKKSEAIIDKLGEEASDLVTANARAFEAKIQSDLGHQLLEVNERITRQAQSFKRMLLWFLAISVLALMLIAGLAFNVISRLNTQIYDARSALQEIEKQKTAMTTVLTEAKTQQTSLASNLEQIKNTATSASAEFLGKITEAKQTIDQATKDSKNAVTSASDALKAASEAKQQATKTASDIQDVLTWSNVAKSKSINISTLMKDLSLEVAKPKRDQVKIDDIVNQLNKIETKVN